ncbi:UspA protein [Hyphomicrobium denitrificans 1NES1]|uniref:Universal stress protein n=1 Tax=Hyphomicrobium denitrificans 1NES1 TaxID=670307 RepID=N0B7P0_9HYPH|nr:universal stress protein [Hyphomicrobium denitrificans]AGK56536.1 UspA protein [Hyphomicrobium denitrificans 1NES1]
MFKHLLIATDGSELSKKAVEQGLSLAKSLGAKVTAVTVTEPFAASVPIEVALVFSAEEYEKAVRSSAENILQSVSAVMAASGIPCETVHVKNQYPADGILDTAQARGCDLIVMGSHGRRGLSRLVLGSQANRVVTQSAVPVLICR